MEKYKRIYWEKGMDITPEIFFEADNYSLFQRNILGQLSAFRSYGIFPESNFEIAYRINNDNLSIRELTCFAITQDGCLIDIKNDIDFKEINLKELPNGEHYIVLKVDSYNPELIEEGQPYARPKYSVGLNETGKKIENGIPVLKIYYNRDNQHREIDENYILPHVAISSHGILSQKFQEIKNELNVIIDKLPDEYPIYFQLFIFRVELNNYSQQESPFEWILLLKKIITIFEFYFKKTQQTDIINCIRQFIEKQYDHNDIAILLQLAIECFTAINQCLETKLEPEPIVEVPPKQEELGII